jgi:hypothetical protein
MKRTILMFMIVIAGCGKSPAPESAAAPASAAASSTTSAPATASAADDPCSLLDDPNALFGQPVTASATTMPNQTRACEWKSAEGRMCGLVTPFGPGWNPVPDVAANYSAMTLSMKAFGDLQPLTGVGEEAVAVDGKILGAQVALRTSKAIANIAAACGGTGAGNMEHVEKLARAIAPKL